MKFILICLMFFGISCHAESLNVYLKIPKNTFLVEKAQECNRLIESKMLEKNQDYVPFNQKFPTHITLYLFNAPKKQVPHIKNLLKNFLTGHPSITLLSDRCQITSSGFAMLNIKSTEALSSFSEGVVRLLYVFRDKTSLIPLWAESLPKKRMMFKRYGSPNVFSEFSPHISLGVLNLSYKKLQDLQKMFSENKQNNSHQSQKPTEILEVGLGITNNEGQIIKELASYQLSSV